MYISHFKYINLTLICHYTLLTLPAHTDSPDIAVDVLYP